MTIKYKEGVPQGILSKPMEEALRMIDTFLVNDGIDTWVTSTSDGKHMKNSKHYDIPCNAADIRIWNILERICAKFRDILGRHYDVVLEKDHIHIEWDPKESVSEPKQLALDTYKEEEYLEFQKGRK